jgi:TetR/AcrR family fatty acid metabolism transcriptional regulator
MAAKIEQYKKIRKAARSSAKKKAIVKAAEKVFGKKGFHEAPLSEIAKEAHISESTIYEYFSTKEELLFSIPAETIREYLNKNQEVLPYIRSSADKLRSLIHRHLSLYANNEDYAKVVMLNLKSNRNFLKTDAYKVVQASARVTTQVIEEGIKNGEFRSDQQPHLVRAMIWGTIEHLVTRKSLLGKPEDLLSLADDITDTILHGIMAPEKKPILNVHVTMAHKNGKDG